MTAALASISAESSPPAMSMPYVSDHESALRYRRKLARAATDLIFKMRLAVTSLVMVVLSLLQADVGAMPADHAQVFFRQAAIDDVDAAWMLLRDNHPAAEPSLGDQEFQARLAASLQLARERARQVTTFEGYLAVMAGFDNRLGDKHVRTKPTLVVANLDWVGLIIGRIADEWIVVDEETRPDWPRLKGAVLVSCDGRLAEAVARERLGEFRADWSVEAQRALAAPWLLVDEHNPFLRPLRKCVFRSGTAIAEVEMRWRPVTRDRIIGRITTAAGAGAAGYGVERFERGWWIAIQEFTESAPAVVAAARQHQATLRIAPFVIIDLRGNGGGSSVYGDELATILYGVPPPDPTRCPDAWRVSPGNIARLESYPMLFGNRLGPDAQARLQSDIRAMREAADEGRAFSRPTRCDPPIERPVVDPRVYLITDRVCFSSCILVVQRLVALGAIQVGEATNADTRYQETRDESLPSGLARFGVQAVLNPAAPLRVGPLEPPIGYPGRIADTDALRQWMRCVTANSGSTSQCRTTHSTVVSTPRLHGT